MSNIIQFPSRLAVSPQVRQAALVDQETITRFKVGHKYTCTSACDSDCVFKFKVLKRSAKFVTLQYHNETHRRRIQLDDDWGEYCLPFGSFSMAPILRS